MNFPIIDRHAAWMVVNPIQGCPNSCKYCFLQSTKENNIEPIQLMTPNNVLKEIFTSKYYDNKVPICFFSHTDIFATDSNIKYLDELLDLLNNVYFNNPLIFITKCYIPKEIIDKFALLQTQGKKIIVYLSYSGLSNTIEPNIRKNEIEENFINLYNNSIAVVHYFRPIIPQNASLDIIDKIIGFTHKYSQVSVIAGLKVEKAYQKKMSFWSDVQKDESASLKECIWPENSQKNIQYIANKYNHPIYETNSCALALLLKSSDKYGFFGSNICMSCNNCTESQRKRCLNQYEKFDRKNIGAKLNFYLLKLNIDICHVDFKIENDILIIKNIPLSTEEICFLSYNLNIRIKSNLTKKGNYWNTSVNDKKSKIIKNKMHKT